MKFACSKSDRSQPSTEERILAAATAVFTEKGYEGTKTRDIAAAAGVKVATLHYYFRHKDDLFTKVANARMEAFSSISRAVFSEDYTLRERIEQFVDRYTELFLREPQLATFCLVESERNPEFFHRIVDFRDCHTALKEDIDSLSTAGKIRPIHPQNLVNIMVGTTIYPFVTRGGIMNINGFNEQDYREMLDEHRRHVKEMILGYLFVEEAEGKPST